MSEQTKPQPDPKTEADSKTQSDSTQSQNPGGDHYLIVPSLNVWVKPKLKEKA